MKNTNSHNRLVVGSNPTEPTKSQVLSELLQLGGLLGLLLGSEGKRKLELRAKTNQELFSIMPKCIWL